MSQIVKPRVAAAEPAEIGGEEQPSGFASAPHRDPGATGSESRQETDPGIVSGGSPWHSRF
jgi:hypothetical protein